MLENVARPTSESGDLEGMLKREREFFLSAFVCSMSVDSNCKGLKTFRNLGSVGLERWVS